MRKFFAIAALFAVACTTEAPPLREPAEPRGRPNILLVTLDTVRADHTSVHGYEKATTPFLSELAERGVRFDRAYATSSWTVPTIASVLTSLEPSAHGVVHGFIENDRAVGQEILSDVHRSLAEQLSDAGYTTAAVTSNGHLTAEFGFAQGFDRYVNHGWVDASLLRNQVEAFSSFLRDTEPWFLWVHLFDPHASYEMREHTEMFLGDASFPDVGLLHKLENIHDPGGLLARGIRTGDRDHEHLTALYDGEIRYADDHVRAIVEQLRLDRDDMIVVTADHGEEFFEHGDCWHGRTLYDEVIRVPLVLRLPAEARAGTVVGHPVSLLDVMPTILELAGAVVPTEAQGQGLFEASRPVRASVAKIELVEALIDPRFKYIHDLGNDEHALYDLVADPGETVNLMESHVDVAAAMRRRIARRILDRPHFDAEQAPLAEEHLAVLRSLGYVN